MIFYKKLNNRKDEKCRFDRQYVLGALKNLVFSRVYL